MFSIRPQIQQHQKHKRVKQKEILNVSVSEQFKKSAFTDDDTGITNVWWRKRPSDLNEKKNQLEIEKSFSDELVEFFHNFTLHCYRWLVQSDRSTWEL